MDRMEIAERLRRFGKSQFGTVNGFAEALGMSQPALSGGYLSGRSIPGGELLWKIRIMGCDLNWLFTGYGLPPNPTQIEVLAWIDWLEQQRDQWMTWMKLKNDAEAAYRRVAEQPHKYNPNDNARRKK